MAAYQQFPRLVEQFDLRALFVPPADRTPFPELLEIVECAHARPETCRPYQATYGCVAPGIGRRASSVQEVLGG